MNILIIFNLVQCLAFICAIENPANGRVLQVVTAELPLIFEINRDEDGQPVSYFGTGYRLLIWLSERLNFKFNLVTLKQFEFGTPDGNGTYDGLHGFIQRKESDIALAPFSLNFGEIPFADPSHSWRTFDFSILIPFPEEEPKTWAALKPFRLEVWLGLIASLISVALAMETIQKVRKRLASDSTETPERPVKNQRRFTGGSSSSTLMYLVGVITAQGAYLARKGRVTIFLSTVWCLVAFVYLSAYSGLLISFLSTARLVPVVNSLNELLQKIDQVPLFGFKGTAADIVFMDATEGGFKVLGDYFRRNPDSRKLDGPLCLKAALATKGACIDATKPMEYFMFKDFKQTKKCRMSRAQETFMPVQVIFHFQRNSPYTAVLNQQILWANDMGLVERWFQQQVSTPHGCLIHQTKRVKNHALRLTDLASAFLLLLIGIACSALVFILENVMRTLKN